MRGPLREERAENSEGQSPSAFLLSKLGLLSCLASLSLIITLCSKEDKSLTSVDLAENLCRVYQLLCMKCFQRHKGHPSQTQ